jgi:hypothetical protein
VYSALVQSTRNPRAVEHRAPLRPVRLAPGGDSSGGHELRTHPLGPQTPPRFSPVSTPVCSPRTQQGVGGHEGPGDAVPTPTADTEPPAQRGAYQRSTSPTLPLIPLSRHSLPDIVHRQRNSAANVSATGHRDS